MPKACPCDADKQKECDCPNCKKARRKKRIPMLKADSFAASYQEVMDAARAKKAAGAPCGKGWSGTHPNCKRGKAPAASAAPAAAAPAPGTAAPAAAPAPAKAKTPKAAPKAAPAAAPAKAAAPDLAALEAAHAKAKAALAALGPEPPKPSSEARAFGTKGRAGASPQAVKAHDDRVKAYNTYRRKYLKLKKEEVAASNAAYFAKQSAPAKGGALAVTNNKLATTAKEQPAAGSGKKTGTRGWEGEYFGKSNLSDDEVATFTAKKAAQLKDPAGLAKDKDFRAALWRDAESEVSSLRSAAKLGITSDKALKNELLMASYGKQDAEGLVKTYAPDNDGKYRYLGKTVQQHEADLEKVKKSKSATPTKIANAEKRVKEAQDHEKLLSDKYTKWKAILDDEASHAEAGRRALNGVFEFEAKNESDRFARFTKDYGEKAAVMFSMTRRLTAEQGLQNDLHNPQSFSEDLKKIPSKKARQAAADTIAESQLRKVLERMSTGGGSASTLKLLGLQEGADLTAESLKAAYRKAAAKAHPDMGGSAAAFQQVNEAYTRLKKENNFDSLPVPYTADSFASTPYGRAYSTYRRAA